MASDQHNLDCRGQLCPKPLLETKRAIAALAEGTLVVTVDNAAARENITRAMVADGHPVLAEEIDGEWTLTITKTPPGEVADAAAAENPVGKTVVLVTDRGLGRSDPDLGALLMKAFMTTISDLPEPPPVVILMQGGVRLACEGSDCLGPLGDLQASGVAILACGTCLDYFGLMDKLEVGRISNMAEIVDTLMAATRTIPL